MLKRKANWTCSYCSKILKDPIELPCDESICREHLKEGDVVKQKKIKCKECNQEFKVKNRQFKSNKGLNKLTETQSYLSSIELSLKQELELSIRKFFDFYEEFQQKKTILESVVFDHFQELRFQIDEHRERLKEKIDDIALEMIAQTKMYEKIYLKDLNVNLLETTSFVETKSLEDRLNEMEDTFRNPDLLVKAIKEMQRKQEKSLNYIQCKLNEINQVKDNLKATNYFKPKLFSFDQNDTSFFGSINLDGYSNRNSLKISQILTNEQQLSELIKLCEFSSNDKWSLLYRGTRDGFGAKDFHSKCDGHSNTLTIVKAKGSEFIFGGFTSINWDSLGRWRHKSDPNAFLFSLTNGDNRPLKIKIDPNQRQYAIYCDSEYGPLFGGGHDICIANNANTTMGSYSDLGYTYKHPRYANGTNEAQTILAGTEYFQLDEIEVHQK
jgi:hypothetical protein